MADPYDGPAANLSRSPETRQGDGRQPLTLRFGWRTRRRSRLRPTKETLLA